MWSRVPIIRLLLPFVSGLLVFGVISTPIELHILVLLSIPVLAGGLYFRLLYGYRSRWLHGIFVLTFIFGCGYYYAAKQDVHRMEAISSVPNETKTFVVCIENGVEQRERSFRSLSRIVFCSDSISITPLAVKLMLYFEPDSNLAGIEPGSFLLIRSQPKHIKPPANPHEFDYREYLARKGIFHMAYVKKNDWKILNTVPATTIYGYAEKVRNSLLEKLKLNGISGRYFGISSALLLGKDSYLDADIRDVYARAGAMHILCVSGLHVGVIFLVLNTVLGFLKRFRIGRLLFPLLLLSSIWSYALLTGLAPPVSRAACMISFFILGNMLGRQKNAYNILAASAFLMIIVDPAVIYSAGFQLSYSAVTGIIALQRPLQNLLYSKYVLFEKIWSITTVSIAAQLGTMPVVLYYFQQLPLYSLLTNLIVIPLSSLIIYSGIVLLLLPVPAIMTTIVAKIFKTLIFIMDSGVMLVESIPGGMAENLRIDIPIAVLTGAMICWFSTYLISGRKAYLLAGLFCMFCFSCYRLSVVYGHETQKEFIVYSVRGHSAYDVIHGRTHHFIADSSLFAIPEKIAYSIKPNWQAKGLNDTRADTLSAQIGYAKCEMLPVKSYHILVWTGPFPRCHPPENLPSPDVLILRGECPFGLEQVYDWFNPDMVIVDSSVPPWDIDPGSDDRIWDVRERGAFTSNNADMY